MEANGNDSRSEYLFFLTQKHLGNLKKRNNPKALLQFIIPVTLQLNAESAQSSEAGYKETRLATRREILLVMKEKITVSAIDDIQQLAYTLSLITVSVIHRLISVLRQSKDSSGTTSNCTQSYYVKFNTQSMLSQ